MELVSRIRIAAPSSWAFDMRTVQSVSSRDEYNAESANGFRFLEQVAKTLGMQAVMEAVQETYKSLYAPGVALLQALNKRANGRAFEELCVKWIADFNKFESALR